MEGPIFHVHVYGRKGTLSKTNSKFAPEKRPTQKGVDASARSKRAAQKASVLGRFLGFGGEAEEDRL